MLSLGLFIFTIGAIPLTLMLSYKLVEPIIYKRCKAKGWI